MPIDKLVYEEASLEMEIEFIDGYWHVRYRFPSYGAILGGFESRDEALRRAEKFAGVWVNMAKRRRIQEQKDLPPLLVELMNQKRWKQPSDALIAELFPTLRDPVDFLLNRNHIAFESAGLLETRTEIIDRLHIYHGGEKSLPWIDGDMALYIAVNREIGADVAITLDFRTSDTDPRVVASDWRIDGEYWVEAFPTLSSCVNALGL